MGRGLAAHPHSGPFGPLTHYRVGNPTNDSNVGLYEVCIFFGFGERRKCRVATNLENLEYSGISLNMEN